MQKVAMISGATSGFGKATATLLAEHGWSLILLGRRKDRLLELQATLNVPTHIIEIDVRHREDLLAAIETIPTDFLPIDLLFNNAGLAVGLDPAWKVDLDDWDSMVDTNVKGLMYCTRAVLPQMVEAGKGLVINVGSTAGTYPYPGANVYGATKAFVEQFSLNLRADLQGTGVKVTNLEPGMAESEFSTVRFKGDQEKAKQVYRGMQPLTADDIARTVLWLVESPSHVNVNRIEVMPLGQSFGPLAVHRSIE